MIISPKILGGAELVDADKILQELGIAERMKIADFGCGGRAYFTLHAAKLIGKEGLVYAIDILKGNLQSVEDLAKFYGLKNVKTIWADLEMIGSTKIVSSTIDLVIITNLFFQTKKHREIFKEAQRVLKSDGKIFVADWKKISSPLGPPVEMRISPEQIKKTVEGTCLKIEKEFEAGPYHFGLVFLKK